MKKIFILPLLMTLLLQIPNALFAQPQTEPQGDVVPAPVVQNPAQCEGSRTWTFTIPNKLCFKLSDFENDIKKVIIAFHKNNIGTLSCDPSNCTPNPSNFKCSIDSIRNPDNSNLTIDSTSRAGQICFSGAHSIDYYCGSCTFVPPGPGPGNPNPTNTNQGIHNNTNQMSISFTDVALPKTGAKSNQIKRLYPNPTDGIFNLELEVEKEDSQINYIVTDISGKVVFEKEYDNTTQASMNTKNDISHLSNGLYFLVVQINGEVIGTSRIMVQKF